MGLSLDGSTPWEKERIQGVAASFNLPDTTFLRLIIQGVISQGGGDLTAIIERGEKVLGDRIVIKRRQRPQRWFFDQEQKAWVWGDWRLAKDPALWRFTSEKYAKDQHHWFHLWHVSDPDARRPVAFRREEAIDRATEMIEFGEVQAA